jgi:hypothetical protein
VTLPLNVHPAFGVGFRSSATTGATKFTVAGTTFQPATILPTIAPAFFYTGIGG